MWDTPGRSYLSSNNKAYFRGFQGLILIYDISDKSSFETVRIFIKENKLNEPNKTVVVLVGNNCDKPDRKITIEEGKKLANEFNLSFFEVSLKTNQNINEMIEYLINEILKNVKLKGLTINNEKTCEREKKNGCTK